jgi:ankyrin repeat protein
LFDLDLSIGGGTHSTVLHLAVAKLDVKAVVKMILRKVDPNVPDSRNGDRPLHLLANVFTKNWVASLKILNFLVDSGADLNAKNFDQWTPLHTAIRKG